MRLFNDGISDDLRCLCVSDGRRLDGHPPKAETWAERAHRSAKVRYPKQDSDLSDLLHTVRTNIRGYDARHKEYTSKVQTVYGPKAY